MQGNKRQGKTRKGKELQQQMEHNSKENQKKVFYRALKNMRKDITTNDTRIKNQEEKIITEEKK